jgi:hypothetical protein
MSLDDFLGLALIIIFGVVAFGAFMGALILAAKGAWWLISGAANL